MRFRSNSPVVILIRAALIGGAFLALSCATVRAPSGGPVDTTPPEIVSTDPPGGTTRFTGHIFTFAFSEYVEHASAENSLHISPPLPRPPEFDWSGTALRVIVPLPLRENTTYVLTLGTDVVDRNNRNKMAHGFTLAVSTGDSIDAGFARGSVTGQNLSGISVFAYRLDGRNADTVNPAQLMPDYLAACGADGSFSFDNIATGTYRFVAVRDKIKNSLYDISTDEFGVLTGDRIVRRNDSTSLPLRFLLSLEDTTRPSLQSAEALDQRHVTATLSEAPEKEDLQLSRFTLRDSAGSTLSCIALLQQGQRANQLRLTTGAPMRAVPYTLVIDSVRDPAGNVISPEGNHATFTGSEIPDSARPIISLSPADKQRGAPPDSVLHLLFSDAVEAADPLLTLRDSAGSSIPIRWALAQPHDVVVYPTGMKEGMQYTFCADLSRFRKRTNGMRAADTTLCVRFTTAGEAEFGSLEGILVPPPSDSGGAIVVEAASADGTGKNGLLRARVRSGGAFAFEKILQGKYLLRAFRDVNGNGRFDPGRPFPFRPVEPWSVLRDTLRVRAKWNTRDVRFPFPPAP